ncbi:hypothetical protein ACFL38_00870 [Candidatus Omnitrophota bacterium]
MLYLFIGTDPASKKIKLAQLKKDLLGDAVTFDYASFFGKDLSSDTLQEELQRLPTTAPKRLIVIRGAVQLSTTCKNILFAFSKKRQDDTVIVLDVEQFDHKNAFLKKISQGARIVSFKQQRALNAFNLAEAIERKNSREALRIYAYLLSIGEHSTRIIGGLIWYWKKIKQRMPQAQFQQGLRVFVDADIALKTGKFKPELAVEMLIVKLCSL